MAFLLEEVFSGWADMKLAICVATMREESGVFPGDIPLAIANSVTDPNVYVQYNRRGNNLGVIGSYRHLYATSTEDILCFLHDDVVIREKGWDARVLDEFHDTKVGIVGFGGALRHGTADLYKTPYRLQQLIRGEYKSNVDDAEVHGERFTGSFRAAVLDGFCLCVRRSFLDRVGGFSLFPEHSNYFCYDYILCALCRRFGFDVRAVGIRCHHRGGSASINVDNYWTSQEAYYQSHRWFYDNFKDVMPASVRA